ncbi:MAG: hypothetical protein ACYTG6_14630, partial [Planctomycetota bacterium]
MTCPGTLGAERRGPGGGWRGPALGLLAAIGLTIFSLTACATAPRPRAATAWPPPTSRPPPRGGGPTLPPTAGGDLRTRSWVKVDDLLWMQAD